MTRRGLLGGALASIVPTDPPPSLAGLAGRRNLLFGTAVTETPFATDPAYARLVTEQAGAVTPERVLKFGALRPSPDRFDVEPADALLAHATAAGLLVRGQNLVWHVSLPDWLAARDDLAAVLDTHIRTVCARYAGRLYAWDVVNEPIRPEDGIDGGLRNSAWLRALGPSYIERAFRAAHEADPHATLVLNEMDIECEGGSFERRRAALLALLQTLKARQVPIHALGIESHLKWGQARFDPDRFGAFLDQVAALGLAVHVTEFDVADAGLPADRAARDRAVAALARDYLSVVLAHRAVRVVSVWELSDRFSWLSDSPWTRRADGRRSRGCLYDDALQPKPARAAFAAALAGA